MAKLVDSDTGEVMDEGVWLVGEFLGVKHPAPYEIRDGRDVRSGVSKPKLGVSVYGTEYSVVASDGVELQEAIGTATKGGRIAVKAYPISGRFGLRWSLSPSAGGTWE